MNTYAQVTTDTSGTPLDTGTTYLATGWNIQPVTTNQKKWRMPVVFGTFGGLYAGTFIGLNELWYADYPKSEFHFIDDNGEWFGLDKFGHAATAYYIGYYTQPIFQWSGMSRKASVWTAGGLGFAYQSTIEILDGFSSEWGASWGDWLANFGGSALFVTQELLWKEQRIMLKMSYWPTEYPSMRPNLLGSNFAEQFLKDYNAQTYWLTCNVWSFLPNKQTTRFPKWFNIAVGYGANGMLGGHENPAEFSNITRYQQFYLSFDIDLSKIETRSKGLRTLFNIIKVIKFPAPTLEFTTNPNKPVNFHWLMF